MAQYEKKNMVLKAPQEQTAKPTTQFKRLPYTGGSATPATMSKSTASAKKAIGANTAAATKKASVGASVSKAVSGATASHQSAKASANQAAMERKRATLAAQTTAAKNAPALKKTATPRVATAKNAPALKKTATPRVATAKNAPATASASRSIAAAKKKDYSVR